MKQAKRIGYATALLCITSLLIAAFMLMFSYYGSTLDYGSKESETDNSPVAIESKPGKVNFGTTLSADEISK